MVKVEYAIMEFSNRIRALRIQKGLTQERLAERARTTKMTVSHIENGRRQLTDTWMRRFAAALECAPADLLPLTDSPPDEAALLAVFRQMPPESKAALTQMLTASALQEGTLPLSNLKAITLLMEISEEKARAFLQLLNADAEPVKKKQAV